MQSSSEGKPKQASGSDFSLNRLVLLFRDRNVEADFAARSLVDSMPVIRLYLLAAVGIYVLFGFLDRLVAGDALQTVWLIRYAFAVPVMLGVFALTYRREFSRYVQPALAFAMSVGGIGIAAMCIVLPAPHNSDYYAGLIMVAVYCGTLLGLRFVYSVSVSAGLLLLYQVISLWINPISHTDYVSNNFFLAMATGIGMFSSYMLETHIRKNYIAQKIIEDKNQVMQGLLDEADAANRAKSEFLATMSHELRTPLNAIIGFSEMIREQYMGPVGSAKYVEYAGDIHDSGQHLLSIISDILDLAKAESGKLELAESEFDFNNVIKSTLKMFQQQAAEDETLLEFEPAPGGTYVRADARLMRQVALNLVSNAMKFTPPGGRISIHVIISKDFGVQLTVEDSGVGIAPENLERVLRPFEQVESSLSRIHGGTGLGLPYSKKVVEVHGGTLTLASKVNHGTTVSVTLPAGRVCAVAHCEERAALQASG